MPGEDDRDVVALFTTRESPTGVTAEEAAWQAFFMRCCVGRFRLGILRGEDHDGDESRLGRDVAGLLDVPLAEDELAWVAEQLARTSDEAAPATVAAIPDDTRSHGGGVDRSRGTIAFDPAAILSPGPCPEPPPADLAGIFDDDDRRHFQGSRDFAEDAVYNWYVAYGAALKPRSVLEIGVRRGDGAWALAQGAGGSIERYVGFDSELDLPGGNARAADAIRRAGIADVEVITADTQARIPRVAGPFDLIHVDGDHSTRGALNDIALATHLLAEGGTIVLDDVESAPVHLALDAALAAFAADVVCRERGGFHRQALITARGKLRPLSPADLLRGAPGRVVGQMDMDRALATLRHGSEAGVSATITAFGDIGRAFRRRLDIAAFGDSGEGHADDDVGDMFAAFAALVEAASSLARERGIVDCPWESEAREHACYALARLIDVPVPQRWRPVAPHAERFEPGSTGFEELTWEAASNMAEILRRTAAGF